MIFFVDIANSTSISYTEFYAKLSARSYINKYVRSTSMLDLWVDILLAFYHKKSVFILDSDHSSSEIRALGISDSELTYRYEISSHKIDNISQIEQNCVLVDTPVLNIYTSGTTGRPKVVSYSWSAITRSIKTGKRLSQIIWGLAYNPTHFAGLQVFFQAIMNRCTIINIFNIGSDIIADTINDEKVNFISATPTYYRNLIARGRLMRDVKNVSIGGEKSDSTLIDALRKIFPQAKMRNIYASTEGGSLFTSDGEVFNIPLDLMKKVRVSKENELLLHSSLLGDFEGSDISEWYQTGDIIDLLDDHKFVVVSRKNEMLNIGGYKVNPHEIEQVIISVDGVSDCRVYSKPNKLIGSIVVADVVPDKSIDEITLEQSIINTLTPILQKFKVPRVYYFLDQLDYTRTGKKLRL
jgi:acyl-coenzyme A synthetase/AMP-(fatty) acid ligase